jgi:uncharacterized damage-inducible protein DinB
MSEHDQKSGLRWYLQVARDALLWKLDDLSEYDLRRPLVPTGTNLLGLVKHCAAVDAAYLGEVFGRPFPDPLPTSETGDDFDGDLWARPDESREDIENLYRRVWAHSDATVDELPLDAAGHVSWWPQGHQDVTLHRVLVHLIGETHRHAGHADIIRELVDGSTGVRARNDNMAKAEPHQWTERYQRLERIAREAADRPTPPG